jgi:hypothetical protein
MAVDPQIVVAREPSGAVIVAQGPLAGRGVKHLLVAVQLGQLAVLAIVAVFAPLGLVAIAVTVIVIADAALLWLVSRVLFGRFRARVTPGRVDAAEPVDAARIASVRAGARGVAIKVLGRRTERVAVEAVLDDGSVRVLGRCYGLSRAAEAAAAVDAAVRDFGVDGATGDAR